MTAGPSIYHHKWICILLEFLLTLHSVESATNMTDYPLYGLSPGQSQ
jgi:hypothetical protein